MSGSSWDDYVEMPKHLHENGGYFVKMIQKKSKAHIDLSDRVAGGEEYMRFLFPRDQLTQDRLVCTDNWVFAWKKICIVMDFQSERAEECLLDASPSSSFALST